MRYVSIFFLFVIVLGCSPKDSPKEPSSVLSDSTAVKDSLDSLSWAYTDLLIGKWLFLEKDSSGTYSHVINQKNKAEASFSVVGSKPRFLLITRNIDFDATPDSLAYAVKSCIKQNSESGNSTTTYVLRVKSFATQEESDIKFFLSQSDLKKVVQVAGIGKSEAMSFALESSTDAFVIKDASSTGRSKK